MTNDESQERLATEADATQDQYPNIHDVLASLPDQEDFPERHLARLEVNCFASGEWTWRAYRHDADESTGGYVAGPVVD